MLAKKYFIFALVSTWICYKYHFFFTICIQLNKNQAKKKKKKPLLSQRDKTVFDNLLIPINCRFINATFAKGDQNIPYAIEMTTIEAWSKEAYILGKMLPACWTSSYRSTIETPCLLSSLKNISSFLNSSNARISYNPKFKIYFTN